MTTYLYQGPASGATLNDGGAQREILLWPGKPVELVPDHPYTLTLLAMGYLKNVSSSRRRGNTTEASHAR